MNLYEINTELRRALAQIEEDPTDEKLQESLAGWNVARTEKFEAICCVLRNFEEQEAACHAEIQRLQTRKQTLQNEQERLRRWLLWNLQQEGKEKEETPLFRISVQKGRERIEIENSELALEWPEDIYAACCKQELKIDKTALKEFKDRFAECIGAKIVVGEPSVRIK